MVYICVICMDTRPRLLGLTPELRRLLEALVAPVINITNLRSHDLLLCGECKVLMRAVYAFQQTARDGVKHLQNLLHELSNKTLVVVPTETSNSEPLQIPPKAATTGPERNFHDDRPSLEKEEPGIKGEQVIKEEQDSDNEPDRECDRHSESTLTCESDYGEPDNIPSYETKMPVISNIRSCAADAGQSANTEVFTHRALGRSSVPVPTDPDKNRKKTRKQRHRVNHRLSPRRPKSFYCDKCRKGFATGVTLRTHQERMHSPCLVECDECGRRFNGSRALKMHKYKRHRKEGSRAIDNDRVELYCAECQMKFTSSSQYEEHMMTLKHVTVDQGSFECEHCKRTFPTKPRLQHHIKCIHHNQKHKCDKCDKSYATHGGLRMHTTKVHDKHNDNVCLVCGDPFKLKSSLKAHLLHQHYSGARPHRCPLCKTTFAYESALDTHIQIKHRVKVNWKKKTDKAEEFNIIDEGKKTHDVIDGR